VPIGGKGNLRVKLSFELVGARKRRTWQGEPSLCTVTMLGNFAMLIVGGEKEHRKERIKKGGPGEKNRGEKEKGGGDVSPKKNPWGSWKGTPPEGSEKKRKKKKGERKIRRNSRPLSKDGSRQRDSSPGSYTRRVAGHAGERGTNLWERVM